MHSSAGAEFCSETTSITRRTGRLLCIAATTVACLWACPALAAAHPAAQPVIAQVYGGGGNIGAPYQNDFVEIFNRSGSTADLTGYSVQYAAATSATWVVTPLSGSLAIGQHLLIAEGNSGGTAGAALPAPEAIGNTDLNLTSGKVALVASFTPLTTSCPSGAQVLDLVGYGTQANCFEGSGPTPNASNVLGVIRRTAGCTDTNNNAADFQALAPTPRNSNSARNPCAPIPAAPTLTSSSPTTPGNSTTPKIIGTAPAGSTVELYPNATCSGAAAATGTAAQLASPGITVTVAAESTNTFYALAYDSNNTSSCSTSSVTYVEDSGVPSPPTLQASNPASPSNSTSPRLKGTAETGSTVRLYSDANCTALAASGSAAQFIEPGIVTPVNPNTTTTFHATATDAAGNVSPCSTGSLTYVEDSTSPSAPTLTSSAPASPSSDPAPRLLGNAEAGSTVRIYTDAACTELTASGTAAQFSSSGIAVSVAANSTTTFHATATDAVGNVSPCSPGSLTYVEDSTPPVAPSFESSTPASPANSTTPRLLGSAEGGSSVRIYTDAGCTKLAATGTAVEFAAPGITVSVAANSTTTFHATATDAVGNVSPCSASALSYSEDSAAPAQPTFASSLPASPSSNPSPRLTGSAEAGSTVRIYTDAACTELLATGSAGEFAGAGIQVTLPGSSTTTFHATATDAVGNTSACSASSLTYVADPSTPDPPLISSSNPASPGSSTSPKLFGTAEPGSTVRIYTDAACSELTATGSTAEFSAGITVIVPADSTTTFYATARNGAGTTSACSDGLTYVEDSSAPAEPTFTAPNPASPGADLTPLIRGNAEAGSTVRIYLDPACTDLAGSGTAAEFAAPGISVSVAAGSTTRFFATATDASRNKSACSAGSVTYVQAALAAPTLPVPRPGNALGQPPHGKLSIADLRVTPSALLGGSRPTRVGGVASASQAAGATILFRLSRRATVTFTILRQPRRRQRPGRLGSPAHALHRQLAAGANSVPFSGRLGNRIFPPGRYRLYAVAVDAEGDRSNQTSVGFRILGG